MQTVYDGYLENWGISYIAFMTIPWQRNSNPLFSSKTELFLLKNNNFVVWKSCCTVRNQSFNHNHTTIIIQWPPTTITNLPSITTEPMHWRPPIFFCVEQEEEIFHQTNKSYPLLYNRKFWFGANFHIFRMMPHRTKIKTAKIFAFKILITSNFERAISHTET